MLNLLEPKSMLEIFILYILFYTILNFIKGTKGQILLKGVIVVIAFLYLGILTVVDLAGLVRLQSLLESILSISVISIVIIFAPEIRRGLIQLAHSVPLPTSDNIAVEEKIIGEIVEGVYELAESRTGGLIAIERKVPLDEWIESGEKIHSEVSSKLIENIFFPGSPLHDGGAIIKGRVIAACSCTFPISESTTSNMFYGMRHKAALGMSEESDAVCIAVSEETGKVTLFVEGNYVHEMDKITLISTLNELLGISAKKPLHKMFRFKKKKVNKNGKSES